MKKKRLILGAIAAALLLALLLYARTRIRFDWRTFAAELGHADWRRIAIGIACIYVGYLFRGVRWALFLRPARSVTPWALFGSQFIGFTAVALLGRPADLVRPYLVARRTGLTLSSQIAVYVVERMFDLGAMALIFSSILLTAHGQRLPHPELLRQIARGGLIGTFALALFTVAVRLSGGTLAAMAERSLGALSPRLGRSVGEKVRAFRDGLNTLRTPLDVLAAAGLSLLMWGLISTAYLETLRAFVTDPTLAGMTLDRSMVLMAASMVASGFQLPVIGWFTQIGIVSAAMGKLFGIPWEPALGCAGMLLIVTFLCVIPAGLIWARFEHVSLRRVTEESEQEAETEGISA